MPIKATFISVIMPVYNAEKYLRLALESILEQTFSGFEFIIIDDGSFDSSLSILKKYALRDKRIRLVSRENRGLISTLNEAIQLSKGNLIARMDADDIAANERLEKQVAFLCKNPEYVAVGTLSTLIDSDGDKISPFGKWVEHEEIDNAHLTGHGGAIIHPSVMIRSDALKKVGGYRKEFKSAEDIDLWLRLAELGKIANINERLILYRQHLESIGYQKRNEQVLNTRKAISEAYQRRNIENQNDAFLTNDFGKSHDSEFEIHIKWGWWALSAKNVNTAKKYAFKCMFKNPFSLKSWKLFICSYRGY